MSSQSSRSKTRYHHGDLQRQLLDEALKQLREQGLQALSLRRLAEAVAVSPAALYHHFRDKQALLCALADEGIEQLSQDMQAEMAQQTSLDGRFQAFVTVYVRFALSQPELYELLFGQTLWKGSGEASEAFRQKARASFRAYADMVSSLQEGGVLSPDLNPLRLAQVMWATLHGLCRMYNDGLAFRSGDVEEISQYARWLLQRLQATQIGREA